ncbi:MAG: CRISPR-associated endonuclease Cas2 [Brooklawnia sp.]|jgi:CRISPR-associated protein Cas2
MTRSDTRRILIAYDIPLDSRRLAIAKILLRYGDRVQYSVFVVDCHPARLQRLRFELEDTMDPSEDSILICDLGPLEQAISSRFEWLGQRRYITPSASMLI